MTAPPTLTEIRDILKIPVTRVTDAELTTVLEAEIQNQAHICVVVPYAEGLRQAVIRRVRRSLALNGAPLGIITGAGDTNTGVGRVSGRDREVERLEFQFLKTDPDGLFGV